MEDFITLADYEVEFLQEKFKINDPDKAVDRAIEEMVISNETHLGLKGFVEQLIRKYQC